MKAYQLLIALAAGVAAIAISQREDQEAKIAHAAEADRVPGVEAEPDSLPDEVDTWFI